MDYQVLFNVSSSFIVFLLGWFVRIAYDASLKMKDDLSNLERQIHTEYVRKEDYKDDIKDIKHMLEAIERRLQTKVDKD